MFEGGSRPGGLDLVVRSGDGLAEASSQVPVSWSGFSFFGEGSGFAGVTMIARPLTPSSSPGVNKSHPSCLNYFLGLFYKRIFVLKETASSIEVEKCILLQYRKDIIAPFYGQPDRKCD